MSAHFHASLKVPATSNSSIGTVPVQQGWFATALAVPTRLWEKYAIHLMVVGVLMALVFVGILILIVNWVAG